MTAAAPVLLALVFGGLMMHLLPSMSRPDIFFAVVVPYEFRLDARARQIRTDYRMLVWTATLLGGVVNVFGPGPASVVASLSVQFAGSWAAWIVAHHRVKPFAIAASPARPRVASLEPRSANLPFGPFVGLGPLVIIGGSAALIWANWAQIPDRFPSRWSTDGTPIGWRTRTFWGVFGPLIMAGSVTSLMLLMAHAIATRTRQVAATGIAAAQELRFKRGHAVYLVLSAYVMAILFSLMAVRPMFVQTTRLPTAMWVIMAVIAIGAIGTTAWMYRIGQGGRRQVPEDEPGVPLGDGTPDAGWKAGVVYYNPADPALLVERRVGFGWTLNFGNKWAWLILAIVIAMTVGPIVLGH